MDLDNPLGYVPAYDAGWTGRGGAVPISFGRVTSRFSETPARLTSHRDDLGDSVFNAPLSFADDDRKMMDYKPETTGYDQLRKQIEASRLESERRQQRVSTQLQGCINEFNGLVAHAAPNQSQDFRHALERVIHETTALDHEYIPRWINARQAEIMAEDQPTDPRLRHQFFCVVAAWHRIWRPGFQPQPRDD